MTKFEIPILFLLKERVSLLPLKEKMVWCVEKCKEKSREVRHPLNMAGHACLQWGRFLRLINTESPTLQPLLSDIYKWIQSDPNLVQNPFVINFLIMKQFFRLNNFVSVFVLLLVVFSTAKKNRIHKTKPPPIDKYCWLFARLPRPVFRTSLKYSLIVSVHTCAYEKLHNQVLVLTITQP